MTTLQMIDAFKFETVEFAPVSPNTLRIRGTITFAHPVKKLAPYLEGVHKNVIAMGLTELNVDITGLTFVNSSAIRLFVDWAMWIKNAAHPYRLVFTVDHARTWQRTALAAIRSLAGESVHVRAKE